MKLIQSAFCLFCFALLMIACQEKPERPSSVLTDAQKASTTIDPSVVTPTPPPVKEPPQNADGVWHYICPDGHEGGGGTSTPCPVCGKNLIHNQAYHANNNADPATTNVTPITDPITTPKTPEPAQNAAGVWHYTCSNGCEGGAGSAVACSKCGNTLSHNSAYH